MANNQTNKRGAFIDVDENLFEEIRQDFIEIKMVETQGPRGVFPQMADLNQKVEELFILYKLRLLVRYKMYSGFLNKEMSDLSGSDFDPFLQLLLPLREDVKNETIQCYLLLLEALEEPCEVGTLRLIIYQIRDLFKSPKCLTPTFEQLDILSVLTNVCIKLLNTGHVTVRELLLRLNVTIVNIGYGKDWKKSSPLPTSIFKNIVSLAVSCKDEIEWNELEIYGVEQMSKKSAYEWIKSFIIFYEKRLSLKSPDKESYVKFNTAYNEFYDGDSLTAFEHLTDKKFSKREFINLDYAMLLLMCVYSLENNEDKTSRQLLKRSKQNTRLILDRYRHLVDYSIKEKEVLDYQLQAHKVFALEFARLLSFREKGSEYKTAKMKIEFAEKKEKFVVRIENIKYSSVRWISKEVKKIK